MLVLDVRAEQARVSYGLQLLLLADNSLLGMKAARSVGRTG